MKITPFVKARYTGAEKRIGRFGTLIPGCEVTLTRLEWIVLERNGDGDKWVKISDETTVSDVKFPLVDDEADGLEQAYEYTTGDQEQEDEQGAEAEVEVDDDGGVQEAEGVHDSGGEVVTHAKTRAHNEDGTFKADDPGTPDIDEAWIEEDVVEILPYNECTVTQLRDEIERRNDEDGAGLTLPPRAKKDKLIKILEDHDATQ